MRKKSFKLLLNLLSSFFLLTGVEFVHAQAPEFIAQVSSDKVVENTVFNVQFELKNAAGGDYQPPSFENFKVVGGPSTSSSTMIINGQVSRSQSWTYSLLAVNVGKFIIGPATVVAGRKALTTRPLAVEVIKAKAPSESGITTTGKEKVLLIAETDTTAYYPGQQILLRYKILFNVNIQSATTISEDDYSDFFVQNFGAFSHQATMENVNGVPYTSRIIKVVALFAHQSGTDTIQPMIMDLGVEAPFPERHGFFSMRNVESVQVSSTPKIIQIIPLPPGAPASFSGAVGQYSITTSSGSKDITTDDAFTLTLTITGNGDSRRWDPPTPIVEGDFEMYEPRIVEDKMTDETEHIAHTRSIEYQMIPHQPGQYTIVVPLTYFNPSTRKYETVSSDTIKLNVTQGTNKRRPSSLAQEPEAPRPLRNIHNITTDDRFWLSIPHLFLFGFIVTGSLWGAWVSYKRRREDQIPAEEKIRSFAARHAREQLDKLSTLSDTIPSKEFFERATEIFYKFLSDKLTIPPADLDRGKISFYLEKRNVAESVREKVILFFDQCLSVRYGRIPGGYTKEEMLAEIRSIISLMEG